jgi:hypothetical protein
MYAYLLLKIFYTNITNNYGIYKILVKINSKKQSVYIFKIIIYFKFSIFLST